jgi:hypothetical protein
MKRSQLNKSVSLLFVTLMLACSSAPSRDLLIGQSVPASGSQITPVQTEKSVALAALVKAPKANLRDKPSVSGGVIETVEKGDLLTLISSKAAGPWYRVRHGKAGPEAWIHGNAIALLYGDPSATEPSSETGAAAQEPRITSPPSSGKTYVNVDGKRVPSPVFSDKKPAGATARCRDGSYSFSQHRQGTCSHHGGVAEWF